MQHGTPHCIILFRYSYNLYCVYLYYYLKIETWYNLTESFKCSQFADKELIAAKDRQEIELAAQRATLEEQRTHIDILDTALTNAQSNVVRLEEEVCKQ